MMLAMIRTAALSALLLAPASLSSGTPAFAQEVDDLRSCRTDYVIQARVNVPEHKLEGTAEIIWRNESGDTVSDLYFHLYHNAFSSNRSTHLSERSRRGQLDLEQEEYGWQQIRTINVGGANVLPSLEYGSPHADEADGSWLAKGEDRKFVSDDRSVFKVDLPRPVSPGETAEIELTWESRIPRVRRRTGHRDDFFLMAHWFPKLGVYEGGRGWNCHLFHANTEFYADYGTYDVTLDLPKEYENRVMGSGVLGLSRTSADRLQVRFVAPSMADRERVDATGKKPFVHGFAWTADPDFVPRKFTFSYDEWAAKYPDQVNEMRQVLGPDGQVGLRDVDVTVMIQPEREAQAERHFEATAAALFFYGLWWGEYPYEHITVVDPAWGARAAGGMEYPTLFTCGTQLFTFPEMHRPENVTIHEAGHQFWYGLVGNNEFEAAWMDEGFNSFTDSEVLFTHYGKSHDTTGYSRLHLDGIRFASLPGGGPVEDALLAKKIELPLDFTLQPLRSSGFTNWWRDQPLLTLAPQRTDPRWEDRSGYLSTADADPIETAAYEYMHGSSYSTNSYPRPAAALRTLMAIVGREPFLRGMRYYADNWRYRHPYPSDFYTSFIEGSGYDVMWYFDQVFRSTETVDWEVSVSHRKAPENSGWFPDDEGVLQLIKSKKSDEDSDSDEAEVSDEEEDAHYLIEIIVHRHGNLKLPLPIQWTFQTEDEEDEPERGTHMWTLVEQEESNYWRLRIESDTKLESVILDPNRDIYLDGDMSNNQWFSEKDRVSPWRWGERVLTQYAHLLHWQADIGG